MRIRIRDTADSDVLAGALTGRKTLGVLLELIGGEPERPELVYLDFTGVSVATASFLRESVLEFRDIVRRRWSGYYPVVANANDTITEELSVLLRPRREVLMLCTLNTQGDPSAPRLMGQLEPKQRMTFDFVKKLGETDAGRLMRAGNHNERVGKTAWNNRLASLSRLGLLIELSDGRTKRYRLLPLEG